MVTRAALSALERLDSSTFSQNNLFNFSIAALTNSVTNFSLWRYGNGQKPKPFPIEFAPFQKKTRKDGIVSSNHIVKVEKNRRSEKQEEVFEVDESTSLLHADLAVIDLDASPHNLEKKSTNKFNTGLSEDLIEVDESNYFLSSNTGPTDNVGVRYRKKSKSGK